MTSVCIVSNEIYPLHKGGIGRLMFNFAVHNRTSAAGVDLHFLLPNNLRAASASIEAEFRDLATIHYCGDTFENLGQLDSVLGNFESYESLDQPMIESLRYYGGLIAARDRRGRDFDFVEFPDYGGWSAASMAAKRAGFHFAKTRFAIRLHSTLSLIVDHEPFAHEPSDWLAAFSDLERSALESADLVIAHLDSTAQLNAEQFGFSPEWFDKLCVQLPPIVLAVPEKDALEANRRREAESDTPKDFLFSSRLQPFKRPDIFVRAAVRFLDHHPLAENRFVIASYGWDPEYTDWVKRLVPPAWKQSILFTEELDERERADLLLRSILVIPSDFESLCLLAHEARQMGVKLILNRRCRAFGAEPALWREEDDCLFFDGDFVSLALAMERALNWSPLLPKPMPPPTCYWERSAQPSCRSTDDPAPLKLGIVIYGTPGLDELAELVQHLQTISAGSKLSVVVPREIFELAQVPEASWKALGVDVHATSWIVPTATEIDAALSTMDVEAVAFVPTQMRIDRAFWLLGARCLAKNPDAAIFTCHAQTPNAERPVLLCHGAGPSTALFADRIAHQASIFRKSCVAALGMREVAESRWYQDLCIRAVEAGVRIVVAPAAMVTDRSRGHYSRIATTRFYATHSAEASRARAHLPRHVNIVRATESIEVVNQNEWVTRQELLRRNLHGSARGRHDNILRIDNAVLKSKSADEASGYQELEIVVRGLEVGRNSISFLGFKLGQFQGVSQLEFRNGGNANQLFTSWPPATADEWGPVAVWTPGPGRHPYALFFEQAPESDIQKLRLVISALPEVIALLPLQSEEKFQWVNIAAALLPEDLLENAGEHGDPNDEEEALDLL